ncbi:MAG: EAL domain-containing protein [Lachnospiraceae bacterium]|nr:EAL domain-containing protein [Lachnospiraceae bacterium]
MEEIKNNLQAEVENNKDGNMSQEFEKAEPINKDTASINEQIKKEKARKKQVKKKKKYQRLRKNKIGLTLIMCVFIALISDFLITLFSSMLISYIVDSKFTEEYKAVSYMAKMYDAASDEGVYSLLNEEGRTYCISDMHGKTIYKNGENTIGNSNGKVTLPRINSDSDSTRLNQDITIYVDKTTEDFVYIDEGGEIKIDFLTIVKLLNNLSDNTNIAVNRGESSVELPVWIAIDVKNGTQVFYGKANLKIYFSDAMYIFIFFLAGIGLVSIIVLALLINLISSVISQKKINKVFYTDPVTGGNNWMWFATRAQGLLKGKKKMNFAVLDVVLVKYRNYCICHSVTEGEQLLVKVDGILNEMIKRKPEAAGHYASANFALMFKYNTREELEARIKELLEKLEKIDTQHRLTFHIGVYPMEVIKQNGKIVARKDIDIDREYNNACTARDTLSDCDDSGIAFYDEKLVSEQRWVEEVMNRFKKAIANEEFVVYYQPKYDPKTDKLRGAEALIRWNCPDDEIGFKNPGEFIPILERNGAIPDIDHYMIEHVARDQKAWLDAGYECVPISVNVSRAHFIENDLAYQIKECVDKIGTPHNLIEIEVTESAFFDDKKVMIDTILKLKEYGFMVSMDDFGSGYSSLNSLKDMPLDVLKLDAEFFRGEVSGGRGEIVVSEAIKLAKNLNMVTVAEGVEEREQVEFLAKQGCDMIQGYVYDKPMPAENYMLKMERDPEAAKKEEEQKEAENDDLASEEQKVNEDSTEKAEN